MSKKHVSNVKPFKNYFDTFIFKPKMDFKSKSIAKR